MTFSSSVFILSLASFASTGAIAQDVPATSPRPIHWSAGTCPAPVFPPGAIRVEATGVTRVSFFVEPSGKVSRIEVAKKSGDTGAHALLDAAAVRAIAACDFGAAQGFGPRRVTQSFEWKLEN